MAWDQSRTADLLRAVETRVTQASKGSLLARGARSIATRTEVVVRNSYGYQWLTAEPDTEVIVIDLRETRTVGPFVRLLERVVDPVDRVWRNSQFASLAAAAAALLAGSRTGQAVVALLEPPKQPERNNDKTE